MIATPDASGQYPLIHCVESDDFHLETQADVLWFRILRDLDWRSFVHVAAQYYEALWAYNQSQSLERERRAGAREVANPETRKEASRRLLFGRATVDKAAPVLHVQEREELALLHVDPARLAPGRVPLRLAGRTPKCFFAMLKAFLGVSLLGRAAEPEFVHQELTNNPSFARTCGFTLPDRKTGYRSSDVPGLRKLEQFDQLMAANALWDAAALKQVRENLASGAVRIESTGAHDTTHYRANSALRVVDAIRQGARGQDVEVRKSQSKATKRCRCADRDRCPHEWTLADEGAGTVVKQRGKMVWGHKASTFSFADQEVLLDAVAMSDAASHDSQSLVPHIERLLDRFPELKDTLTRILDDGALDDAGIKAVVRGRFGIELCASPNPRGRKPIREDLPRGIDHITQLGVPVCAEGFPFDFLGCRHGERKFIFRAPGDEDNRPVCNGCPRAGTCLRKGGGRRHVTVSFERLPFIDPELPHLSHRFHRAMARRTVIERLHKLMKFDYGDERLTKRGNAAFQARLDKTLLAMHVVIASP